MLLREYDLDDYQLDGRTLTVRCVPFDVEAVVDDGDGPYREMFRRGAFTQVLRGANRTELRYAHGMAPSDLLGFAQSLDEAGDGLRGEFRVAPSPAGDQMLALVRDGQLRGMSIGYLAGEHPDDNRRTDASPLPLVERLRVRRLSEVSLVRVGAYVDAEVLAVRRAAELDLARLARDRARLDWEIARMALPRC